jgi:FkbM family methyltransferase
MFMSLLKTLNKAEYFYNPISLVNRIKNRTLPGEEQLVSLPWKNQILVSPKDVIGKAMYHLGVYELPLSEMIWRSITEADTFLDIGANIGYFTCLANAKNGGPENILSFEAHPKIFSKLKHNVSLWNDNNKIKIHHQAITSKAGTAVLNIPKFFSENCGVSSLESIEGNEKLESVNVEAVTIDSICNELNNIIIKIDIEGHEVEAFKGATRSFKDGKIKAIFFEEHRPYPCETFEFLENAGFKIIRIDRGFFSPKISPVGGKIPQNIWEPLNYLAYLEDSFIKNLESKRGWSILK